MANTNIINLTPHTITIIRDGGENIVIPASGLARASQERVQVADINGIPVNRVIFGDVVGLPDPQPDTIFVVSSLTAQAVPDRQDVFITDEAVRDEAGRVIGCRALAHI